MRTLQSSGGIIKFKINCATSWPSGDSHFYYYYSHWALLSLIKPLLDWAVPTEGYLSKIWIFKNKYDKKANNGLEMIIKNQQLLQIADNFLKFIGFTNNTTTALANVYWT